MTYSPFSRVSAKLPERPSERFSFSPRIVSPSMISISVTLPVPAFSISKLIGPAGALASCGSQPASVSLKVIFLAPGGASSLEPQAATERARTLTAATIRAARRVRRFIGGVAP
jgi:hypothetical protein